LPAPFGSSSALRFSSAQLSLWLTLDAFWLWAGYSVFKELLLP
jgi:hypothetical protein